MILIADSGSTKTLWSLQDHEGSIRRFETKGFNPYFSDQQQLVNTLNESEVLQGIHRDELIDIYFYGAGCFPDKAHTIEQAMHSFFSRAFVHVELDLLGAARGLLGHSDGFVGILGTGANSGLFVGGKIVQNIDSLGYILGDEGSGCYIGNSCYQRIFGVTFLPIWRNYFSIVTACLLRTSWMPCMQSPWRTGFAQVLVRLLGQISNILFK